MNYAAGVFWPAKPAPWEAVDAYYYPDRSNLSVHKAALGVSLDLARSEAELDAGEQSVA